MPTALKKEMENINNNIKIIPFPSMFYSMNGSVSYTVSSSGT
jgi:hypothetical protein